MVLGAIEQAAQPIIGPPGDVEQTVRGALPGSPDEAVDNAATVTDTAIDVVQGGAGATQDVVNDTLDFTATGSTEAAGHLGRLSVDPALAFLGLGGLTGQGSGGGQEQQSEQRERQQSGSGNLLGIGLLAALGAGAAALVAWLLTED